MNQLRFFCSFMIGFIIYFLVDANFFSLLQKEITSFTRSKSAGHIMAYTLTLIPLLITLFFLEKRHHSIPEKSGQPQSVNVGFMFAFVCTFPMLVAYAIKFPINRELTFDTIIINTISSAFFEEIIYRAFLFGMLYRFTRLGFLPAVFLGSLLFGIAHLYQSTDFNELIGIFLVTFLGSVLFAWIYAEWQFNLWTAVFLHFLMNLYWLIFDAGDNALGGMYANVFRFLSVFLAIAATVLYLEVNRKTWWIKTVY